LTVTEINRPPELAEIPILEVDELKLLEFQIDSSDPDIPRNLRIHSLIAGPPGMSVTPEGVLRWMPSEGQAPSLNTVVVDVRDNGNPPLSASRQFSIRVREVNSPPILNAVADRPMLESERLQLTLTAEDPDLPANALLFSLVSGPAGLSVSESGLLVWAPTEQQGPSVNRVVVRVTDNGDPPLSGTTEFTVTVEEENRPPVLVEIPKPVIEELREWNLTLAVEDPVVPADTLSFSLIRGPEGMALTPDGRLRWTPEEGQGPSIQVVEVKVSDNGIPPLSATNQFEVVVTEVNSAPRFRLLPTLTVDEFVQLEASLGAEDDDLPVNGLNYSLISGPAGLTLSASGVVLWTPREDQGPSTNI
ncbi:MAG: hypothetical protein Q7U84_05535, partial [Polynucleobacter sp.]|nr:hypothetical protein [Polynucleobacter sp.]